MFPTVWVQGEISNLKTFIHSSGHCYFSLKDSGAQLSASSCFCDDVRRLLIRKPESGLQVIRELVADSRYTRRKDHFQMVVAR